MRDGSKVALSIGTLALLLALTLLTGCAVRPAQYHQRDGDFILNIGSAPPTRAPAAVAGAGVRHDVTPHTAILLREGTSRSV